MSPAVSTPRSAYVHVPFCRHRCGYCNFTLVAGRDDLADDYLRAMRIELASLGEPRPIDTLFLGGGTPTQLGVARLEALLVTLREWLPLADGAEFSLEANPADVDEPMLRMLAAAGVNRVSLGGQSFDRQKLALLERDHTPQRFQAAATMAQEHIASVSIDLIFGVPGETLPTWQADLAEAMALQPNHVSTYGLTFERGTSFWNRLSRGELLRIDEELERSMYATAIDTLTAAGFEHYEVSNFARPGHRCRHNEVYWAGDGYYAFGPGASRYVDGRRETNHRSTTTYLKRVLAGESAIAEIDELPPEDRAREAFVFAMRRIAGVDRREFVDRFGDTVDQLVGQELRKVVELGLIEDDGQRLRLTREGLFISDAIWSRFLRR